MKRRRVLAASAGGLLALSGCVTARRTGTLVFDPIPPDRPDDCPRSQKVGVEFPVSLEDDAVISFVREYETALQERNGVGPDRLSIDVTLTDWSDNYIADLAVVLDADTPEEHRYSAAYYVGEFLLSRTAVDGGDLPPDPREGEVLECRRSIDT